MQLAARLHDHFGGGEKTPADFVDLFLGRAGRPVAQFVRHDSFLDLDRAPQLFFFGFSACHCSFTLW